MLEEAGREDCLEEGSGSLHRRVEVQGLPGVSAQLSGVGWASSWRGRFVQPQLEVGAEATP